jgi:hypothetical protein
VWQCRVQARDTRLEVQRWLFHKFEIEEKF